MLSGESACDGSPILVSRRKLLEAGNRSEFRRFLKTSKKGRLASVGVLGSIEVGEL